MRVRMPGKSDRDPEETSRDRPQKLRQLFLLRGILSPGNDEIVRTVPAPSPAQSQEKLKTDNPKLGLDTRFFCDIIVP